MLGFLQSIVVPLDFIVGVGIILLLFFYKRINSLPVYYKLALWIGSVGLVGQALRSLLFLVTGTPLAGAAYPVWILKDAGYWILLAAICFDFYRDRLRNKSA